MSMSNYLLKEKTTFDVGISAHLQKNLEGSSMHRAGGSLGSGTTGVTAGSAARGFLIP
jgi:hypothetical protein